jgi:hypothetical protein
MIIQISCSIDLKMFCHPLLDENAEMKPTTRLVITPKANTAWGGECAIEMDEKI